MVWNGHAHLRWVPRAKGRRGTKVTTECNVGSATSRWATTLPQCRNTSTGTGPVCVGSVTTQGWTGRTVLRQPPGRSKGETIEPADSWECRWRITSPRSLLCQTHQHASPALLRSTWPRPRRRTRNARRRSEARLLPCRLARRFAEDVEGGSRHPAAVTVKATGHCRSIRARWWFACLNMASESEAASTKIPTGSLCAWRSAAVGGTQTHRPLTPAAQEAVARTDPVWVGGTGGSTKFLFYKKVKKSCTLVLKRIWDQLPTHGDQSLPTGNLAIPLAGVKKNRVEQRV